MQTIWDLLPASLWPTQSFISPDEAARVLQAMQALQAPGNSSSLAAIGPGHLASAASSPAPKLVGPAAGGDDPYATWAAARPRAAPTLVTADTDAPGGILGAIFGEAADRSPAPAASGTRPVPARQTPAHLASAIPGFRDLLAAPGAAYGFPTGMPLFRTNGAVADDADGWGTRSSSLWDSLAPTTSAGSQKAYRMAQHGWDSAPPPPADFSAQGDQVGPRALDFGADQRFPIPPVVAPAAASEASGGALASRLLAVPGATAGLAAAMLLAMTEPLGDSTRKLPQQGEDPEYRPQFVLRGGLSKPENLRVDPLSEYGLPGQFGISSASAPNMTVDEIARRAQFRNRQMTYTTKREINGLGYPVEPTGPQTRLHHSIMLPPGEKDLTEAQLRALSALFQQHVPLFNPYRPFP